MHPRAIETKDLLNMTTSIRKVLLQSVMLVPNAIVNEKMTSTESTSELSDLSKIQQKTIPNSADTIENELKTFLMNDSIVDLENDSIENETVSLVLKVGKEVHSKSPNEASSHCERSSRQKPVSKETSSEKPKRKKHSKSSEKSHGQIREKSNRRQRKRTSSISSSHMVLERKLRNSLRIKTLIQKTKVSDQSTSRAQRNVNKVQTKKVPKKISVVKAGKRRRKTSAVVIGYPSSKRRKLSSSKVRRPTKYCGESPTLSTLMEPQKEPATSGSELSNTVTAPGSDSKENEPDRTTQRSQLSMSGETPQREETGQSSRIILSLPSLDTPVKADTLLDKEFPEDDDDEEYKPNEDELKELDDTFESKSATEEVDQEDLDRLEEEVQEATADAVHYMTRSKISYTDQALEDIERAFIPPDIDFDMYDSVIDDQDWKEFLTEFTKPIERINTNEDDDTEFIPETHEEEIDSEELRRDPGVKVSKKELNELMGELFELNEICDYHGDENIDNINDYVNLKFNETISEGVVKLTPTKRVHFADTALSRESSTQKLGSARKIAKKKTPDKHKKELSEEISKQIMEEINNEIQKYIEINETYVYGGAGNTSNYDSYEEYIVVIGSDEPTAEEINKLTQVKMADSDKAKENSSEVVKEGDPANEEKNEDAKSKEEDGQQLSIKLVQKKVLPSKMSRRKTAKEKKSPPPPKPPKKKRETDNPKKKYQDLPKKQYNELLDLCLNAIERYKTKFQIENDNELPYHSVIHGYGSLLYRKTCDQTTLTVPFLEDPSVAILDDDNNNKENITETNYCTAKGTAHKENIVTKNPIANANDPRKGIIIVNKDIENKHARHENIIVTIDATGNYATSKENILTKELISDNNQTTTKDNNSQLPNERGSIIKGEPHTNVDEESTTERSHLNPIQNIVPNIGDSTEKELETAIMNVLIEDSNDNSIEKEPRPSFLEDSKNHVVKNNPNTEEKGTNESQNTETTSKPMLDNSLNSAVKTISTNDVTSTCHDTSDSTCTARGARENTFMDTSEDFSYIARRTCPSQIAHIETEIATIHLFDPEDLKLLQQHVNQHIQYSLQHYLQTYQHPRLSHLSRQAKRMIETFHLQRRRKGNASYFNSLNLERAMLLVNSWERMGQNEAFTAHIHYEWSRCLPRWRDIGNTLTLPQLITTTILNNEAFIYPVLLPGKSFAPTPREHRLNSLELSCELNLLVLGLINYCRLLTKDTQYRRLSLLYDVLNAIQRNYLPAHSMKNIAKRIVQLVESPQTNIVQRFFKEGHVEEIQHYIIDYSEDNVVAPKRQYMELLPPAWQDCVREFR